MSRPSFLTAGSLGVRRTPETGSESHGDRVINYLNGREKANAPEPFFIYFGFSHPHDVHDGTPDLLKKYGAVNHRDKKSLPPANPKASKLPLNWLPRHPFHQSQSGLPSGSQASRRPF